MFVFENGKLEIEARLVCLPLRLNLNFLDDGSVMQTRLAADFDTIGDFLEAILNSLTHLRFLHGPDCEEDGKVRRELPGEGLSEGQQEVGAGADEPGVLAAAAHPLEGRRRRLEVPRLRHRQRVHRT